MNVFTEEDLLEIKDSVLEQMNLHLNTNAHTWAEECAVNKCKIIVQNTIDMLVEREINVKSNSN